MASSSRSRERALVGAEEEHHGIGAVGVLRAQALRDRGARGDADEGRGGKLEMAEDGEHRVHGFLADGVVAAAEPGGDRP